MKVKVTPPYEGAGSWEDETVDRQSIRINGEDGDGYFLKSRMIVPVKWCKPIPEVVPEPGDIVEGEHGLPFFYDPVKTYSRVVRVLARKPKGYEEIQKEFTVIFNRCGVSYRSSYHALVALILGGAECGRVDK